MNLFQRDFPKRWFASGGKRHFLSDFLCASTIKIPFRTVFGALHRKYIIFLCVSFLKKGADLAYLINLHKTIDTPALLCYTRYIERKQTEKQRKKDAETDNETNSAENTK